MPKFKICILRTSYAHNTVEIEAKDMAEAKEIALGNAGNELYKEFDAEYFCEEIEAIGGFEEFEW